MQRKERVTKVATISVMTLELLEARKEEIIQIFEDIITRIQVNFPSVVDNLWEDVWTKDGLLAFAINTFYTSENWEMMKACIKRDASMFGVSDSDRIAKSRRNLKPDLLIHADVADRPLAPQQQKRPYGMRMSINKEIHETCFRDDFTVLFERIAKTTRAVTGYVEYFDTISYDLLYKTTPKESAELWDKCVSGYYWGLLLTENHIAALGGMEAVKENAPVYLVKELQVDGKPALYLQLTEDIFHITREQRLAYKEYLKPLMPEIDYVKAAWEKQFYKNRRIGIAVFTEEEQKKIDELAALPIEELREMIRVIRAKEQQEG